MKNKSAGFSLIELLIVLIIVGILSAFVVSRGSFSSKESHGGEQLINDLTARLSERRVAVQRLNGASAVTSFDLVAAPIEFNLEDPATTASLVTEGVDENADGIDDITGDHLTFLAASAVAGEGVWRAAYREDTFKIPTDWQLCQNAADLGSVPLISDGLRGRGVIVTRIAFDAQGRASYRNDSGVWETTPSGTSTGSDSNESAFWAFYFVRPGQASASAVAVGVFPASGTLEKFRYDGTTWKGFADRIPTNR